MLATMSAVDLPVPTRTPIRKVGFYGCNDKVVRLETDTPLSHYPKALRLSCPACGHEHTAAPFWRAFDPRLDSEKSALILPT